MYFNRPISSLVIPSLVTLHTFSALSTLIFTFHSSLTGLTQHLMKTESISVNFRFLMSCMSDGKHWSSTVLYLYFLGHKEGKPKREGVFQ